MMSKKNRYYLSAFLVLMILMGCRPDAKAQNQATNAPNKTDQKTIAPPSQDQFFQRFEAWAQQRDKMFDQFFNDPFFKQSDNIFQSMDQMRQQMEQMFQQSQRGFFNDHYNGWFHDQFGLDTSEYSQEEKEDGLHIHLKIPGLEKGQVKVEVKEDHIVIEGEQVAKEENENKQTQSYSQSFYSSKFQKMIPLPYTIDPGQVKYESKKDELEIIIPKEKKNAFKPTSVI